MYVSFVPPMVAIAEHPGSRTWQAHPASGAFSVSFLHASQQDIAERAGRSAEGPDKFATLKIKPQEAAGGRGRGAGKWPKHGGAVVRRPRLFAGDVAEMRVAAPEAQRGVDLRGSTSCAFTHR